jgi:membrane protease YdiL (CAAX protease family)
VTLWKLQKIPLTEGWPTKLPVTILILYFLAVFPLVHFVFRNVPWISEYGYLLFFAAVPLSLLAFKKATPADLGFSLTHIQNHLFIGGVIGGAIAISPQILDTLIGVTGLDQSELFAEGAQQTLDKSMALSSVALAGSIIIIPIIKQVFFTGFIAHFLIKRINPVLAIYAAGILFTLVHLKLSLGLFLTGAVSAYLFNLTGTLYAPILFHAGIALTDALLTHVYPRLITLVGFLY